MRERKVGLSKFGITEWQYAELRAFARQYDEKKRTAAAMLGPRRTRRESNIERIVMDREQLLRDVNAIEFAAENAGGGGWKAALLANCCRGIGYTYLDPTTLPTSDRNRFYRVRAEFYCMLAIYKFHTHGDAKS